jgi:hypothetical protein
VGDVNRLRARPDGWQAHGRQACDSRQCLPRLLSALGPSPPGVAVACRTVSLSVPYLRRLGDRPSARALRGAVSAGRILLDRQVGGGIAMLRCRLQRRRQVIDY